MQAALRVPATRKVQGEIARSAATFFVFADVDGRRNVLSNRQLKSVYVRNFTNSHMNMCFSLISVRY